MSNDKRIVVVDREMPNAADALRVIQAQHENVEVVAVDAVPDVTQPEPIEALQQKGPRFQSKETLAARRSHGVPKRVKLYGLRIALQLSAMQSDAADDAIREASKFNSRSRPYETKVVGPSLVEAASIVQSKRGLEAVREGLRNSNPSRKARRRVEIALAFAAIRVAATVEEVMEAAVEAGAVDMDRETRARFREAAEKRRQALLAIVKP
jgi:hypothetical protein